MNMRISIAISTLGRASISSLLESVLSQEHLPHEIVIADQGPEGLVDSMVEPYISKLNIRVVPSTRGVSIGRNAAASALADCDAIFFTDDDCTLPANTLKLAAAELLRDTEIMTGRVVSTLGERGQPSNAVRQRLNRANVWPMSLEANMLFSMPAFKALRGFDETLGVGAQTPWQSGEGTEILIRAIDSGMSAIHAPLIVVHEHAPKASLGQLSRKTRQYGRGTGRVYAMHYSLRQHLRVAFRPILGSVLRLVQGRFRESWLLLNASIGRIYSIPSRFTSDA